uniref:hypothetical protein n=1 Tax=uncultured Marinobacter sp. TaxID=187379 RepID=UPI0025922A25
MKIIVNQQGYESVQDFAMLEDDDIDSLFKSSTALSKNSHKQCKMLKGLAAWLRDREDGGRVQAIDEVTSKVIRDRFRRPKDSRGAKESLIKPIVPHKWIGTAATWLTFRKPMESYLAMLTNSKGEKLTYLILNVQFVDGTSKADPKNGRYQGFQFKKDNADFFQIIKTLTGGSIAFDHIKAFELAQDGRGAWRCLCCEYQGTLARQNRVLEARSMIQTLKFTGKSNGVTMEVFCARFRKAYNDLEEYGEP